jgi:hypothetical protein
MSRRTLYPLATLALVAAAAFSSPSLAKWPPWISIESPVNPYSVSARGALLLVHATFREGTPKLSDVSGAAEGLVNGSRRTVALRFDETPTPGVFALRRQWPAEGAWLARISLSNTTAVVVFDQAGNVASVRVPTETNGVGDRIPRAVPEREIDSTLIAMVKR